MGDCQYPDCKAAATRTWALVPLCQDHQSAIKAETLRYYAVHSVSYQDRVEYLKIMHLIPWSRKE